MTNVKKEIGRIVAGGYYDLQEIRIGSSNRIRDVVRKKIEGIEFDQVEEKKEENKKAKKYTDEQMKKLLAKLNEQGKTTTEEYKYLENVFELLIKTESLEATYKRRMLEYVKQEKIYKEFLSKIKGIGPVLATNLIKEFGYCENYENVAKLWAHTGNGVEGGKAPRRKKGEDLTFSPRLRTITWKISDCLLKRNHGIYRQIYDTEKEKQLSKEYEKGVLESRYGKPYTEEDTKLRLGHAHSRALRKMRKLFLSHYWAASKELTGQESRELYVVEKLGHNNIITWQEAVKVEEDY